MPPAASWPRPVVTLPDLTQPRLDPDRIRQAESREKSARILNLANTGNVNALVIELVDTGWSLGKRLRYAREFVNSDGIQRARMYAAISAAASDAGPFRGEHRHHGRPDDQTGNRAAFNSEVAGA